MRRPCSTWRRTCCGAGRGRAPSPASGSTGRRVFVRAHAAPLRSAQGEITGIVIMAREATRRGGQRASDRIGLLERIGERLSSSLELDVTLRQVAETLVPQFADHCFIDLLPWRHADPPCPAALTRLDAGARHLGAGRRAHHLSQGALLRARHVPPGHGRGRGHRRAAVPGTDAGEPEGLQKMSNSPRSSPRRWLRAASCSA